MACIAECILACLASILEYFNKWAFVYVGLYGYSYLEAGRNVITLFQNRGWEAIIADDLVGNTMFLVSVIVGGLTGCVGLIVQATSGFFDTADEAGNDQAVAFLYVPCMNESCVLSDVCSNCFLLVFFLKVLDSSLVWSCVAF